MAVLYVVLYKILKDDINGDIVQEICSHRCLRCENIIPVGMTVSDVVKRFGVGGLTLLNLLDGKSILSSEIAVRLEKMFGTDQKWLLGM